MTFEEIKEKVRTLSSDERRKLVAFIVALEDRNRPDYATELAQLSQASKSRNASRRASFGLNLSAEEGS
jgi:hypothetical protein